MSGKDGFFATSMAMAEARRADKLGAAGAGRGSANLSMMDDGLLASESGSGRLMLMTRLPPIKRLPLLENSKAWVSKRSP